MKISVYWGGEIDDDAGMKNKEFPARHRFNWGFHDATADKVAGRDRRAIPHGDLFCLPVFDSVYCAGYSAGQNESVLTGRPESSECAWIGYCTQQMAERAMAFRAQNQSWRNNPLSR